MLHLETPVPFAEINDRKDEVLRREGLNVGKRLRVFVYKMNIGLRQVSALSVANL